MDTAYDGIQNYMKHVKPFEDLADAMSPSLERSTLVLNDLALFIIDIRIQINNFLSEKYREELEELLLEVMSPYKKELDSLLEKKSDYISDIYDIVMLEYKDDPKLKDNEKVFSKIENAKKHWEKIMKKDFDEDIDSSLIGE